MKWYFKTVIFCLSVVVFAQPEVDTNSNDEFEYSENDSVHLNEDVFFKDEIELEDAEIYSIIFNSDLEKRYYVWLRKRVRDVWPFVLQVQKEYYDTTDSAALITNKKQKKKFMKQKRKDLSDKFESKLKALSTSRGQILNKLIYRETGKTVHQMVKEFRGGFNAFLWNTAGNAFSIDTKAEFHPSRTREDLYIEVILRKDFSKGILVPFNQMDWENEMLNFDRTKRPPSHKK